MQDAVIARQDEEMSVMASRLANLQTELSTSSTAVDTLQLKSSGKQVWHGRCQQIADGGVICAWPG